ncbi:hypothetical protein [Myxosarcina sp. GI1(2024)]
MKLKQQMQKLFPKLTEVDLISLPNVAVAMGTFGLFNTLILPAAAEDYIGNQGISFDRDTIVEFEFIESHGAYQSTFGAIDLDSCQTDTSGAIIFDSCDKTPLFQEVKPADNYEYEKVYSNSSYETDLGKADSEDFIGTPGNTVPQPKAEFLFEAGKRYAFYLESQFEGQPSGVVYSTDLFNSENNRQALFENEILSTTEVATRRNSPSSNRFANLVDGGLLINFEDTGATLVKESDLDADFDDFVVGVGGSLECLYPEME